MALEAPEAGWTWLTIPRADHIQMTVIGDVHTWHTHWTTMPGDRRASAVRCVRAETRECHLCRANHERRTRYVFPVLHEGQPRLVELGRCQYPALAMCHEPGPWVGTRLELWRERPHPNAVIRLRDIGRDHVSTEVRVDISAYVSNLGTDTLRLFTSQKTTERRDR